MPTARDDVLQAALHLSESDRLLVVKKLLESLPPDTLGLDLDDEEFAAELDRRSGDWEGAVTWEELRNDLQNPS